MGGGGIRGKHCVLCLCIAYIFFSLYVEHTCMNLTLKVYLLYILSTTGSDVYCWHVSVFN